MTYNVFGEMLNPAQPNTPPFWCGTFNASPIMLYVRFVVHV